MARAGSRTLLVDILWLSPATGPDDWGERPRGEADLALWRRAWAGLLPAAGQEVDRQRQTEVQIGFHFDFDYVEVMEPDESGNVLNETMVLRFEDPAHPGIEAGLYDIDTIQPDFATRRSVQVLAYRKRLRV